MKHMVKRWFEDWFEEAKSGSIGIGCDGCGGLTTSRKSFGNMKHGLTDGNEVSNSRKTLAQTVVHTLSSPRPC